MKTIPDESAFSAPAFTDINEGRGSARSHDRIIGLTKREYFAAMAMQGLIACPRMPVTANNIPSSSAETIAVNALRCADALIDELNKR